MPKNYCIMQIWAESGKSALPICNYSQILYQFLTFTQNLKRSQALLQAAPARSSSVALSSYHSIPHCFRKSLGAQPYTCLKVRRNNL